MPEFEEQQHKFDLDRMLDLARRRHLHFLVPLVAGWLLVWAVSWVLPVRYKSSTLILVQQPTVPKDYVVSNINDDIGTRLESLKQQLMSRTRLLTIINKLGLYHSESNAFQPEKAVAQMQKDISVDLVRNEASGNVINSFRVSYLAPSPLIAQRVTSELTSLFINYNQQQIVHESETTTSFITKQLEAARATLAQQEARVREFQTAHQGELPSQQASNLQILGGLQQQLQNEQDALNTARQQRVYLQALVEQSRAAAPTEPTNPDAPANELAALNVQLKKMRRDLADLRARYTEQHPAVQNLEAAIAQTKSQRDQMAASMGLKPDQAADTAPGQTAAFVQLQSQLKANQIEISNREQDIGKLQARINEYQARLNAEPAAEQELAELTRGYEQSQATYNDLLKKKNDSAMATSMEQMQQGERFSVLDPPSLPQAPDSPKRLNFCGIGLLFGLALGAATVALFEYLDDRLHTDREIEDMLPIGVLSEIPEILRPDDERRRKRIAMLGWAAAASVAVIILAGTAFSYLHG